MVKSEDRKSWEKEQKRKRIIDMAQNVFFTRGFDNATMDEIAAEAGYNKRTIYLYFKDKEELFLAVVLRGMELLLDTVEKTFELSRERESLFRDIATTLFNFFTNHPEYFNLMMIYESRSNGAFGGEDEGEGNYLEGCRRISGQCEAIMTNALEIGISRGAIETDLTAKQLMLILWGGIVGTIQIIMMRKDSLADSYGIDADELFRHFLASMETTIYKKKVGAPV